MADCITLAHPGDQLDLSLELGGAMLSFDFERSCATANRVGQDLIFTINDAVELTLEGYFANFSDKVAQPINSLRKLLKLGGKAVNPGEPLRDFLFQEDSEIFF